jgi:hypothetical protein
MRTPIRRALRVLSLQQTQNSSFIRPSSDCSRAGQEARPTAPVPPLPRLRRTPRQAKCPVVSSLVRGESLSPLPSLADLSFRSCGKSVADVLCIICFADCELQVCHCCNSACMITTAVSLSRLVVSTFSSLPPTPPPHPPLLHLLSWLLSSSLLLDPISALRTRQSAVDPPPESPHLISVFPGHLRRFDSVT